MSLTDTAIRALEPKDKPYKVFDGGGLYIEVAPSGGKCWRLKYRIDGKEKRISLGVYPETGLKAARGKREDYKRQISQGIDPGTQRKQDKMEAAAIERERINTFEHVARDWYEKNREKWTRGHADMIIRRLEKYIFPYIGNRSISKLETPDYVQVIRLIEDRGTIETAKRIAQVCGQITTYAMAAGIVKNNYAVRLAAVVKQTKRQHLAAITDPAEFGQLLADINAYPGEPAICHALKILPYVFVRSGELRGALWEEIDLDAGQWIVPGARMKMRRPHIVPLAPKVIALFRSMREYSSNSRLVFPSTHSATRCISDMGLLNALRRMGYSQDKMTIHGFRSTASTLLNGQGYNRDWIEAQLAHAEKNAIRDAYNRADYLPERRNMMMEWADYIDSLREEAVKCRK